MTDERMYGPIKLGAQHEPDCCCEQCICRKEEHAAALKLVVEAIVAKLKENPLPTDDGKGA